MDLPPDILQDPELYGLRRSRRSHNTESKYVDSSDDESGRRKPRASRKKKMTYDSEEEDDAEENAADVEVEEGSDDDEFTISSKPSRSKFAKRRPKKASSSSSSAAAEVRFSTRNNNKSVNYNIDNENDDDLLESGDEEGAGDYVYYDQPQYYGQPVATDGIDFVMNHKIVLEEENEDANDADDADEKAMETTSIENETKLADRIKARKEKLAQREVDIGTDMNAIKEGYMFLIKWNEKSHLHNTWEYYKDLVGLKGIKKIDNYIKANIIIPFEIKSDPSITREDLEQMSLEREKKVDEINEYKTIERIVDYRREQNPETGESELQYFVKWRSLHYDACTWESATEIAQLNPLQVTKFQNRTKSKILPNLSANYGSQRPPFEKLVSQPVFIKNGELRDFQLTGLNWMAFLWSRNENGILADEMGLGKTVQTVSFLSWLIYARRQNGPHIVVVPLSTMPAWQETFDKWAPDVNVVYYIGNTKARKTIRDYEWYQTTGKKKPKFNVLLTTYEYVLKDRSELGSLKWQFLAVDEAHRLKNAESSLYEALGSLKVSNRLLITGTPLQNNIKELAALVNFLMPGKFTIDQEIDFDTPNDHQEEYIRGLHKRLQPFILRRLKKDVEKSLPSKTERILRVELSDLQTQYYKNILTKNYTALNAGVTGGQVSLLNIMAELKKASNHPYLFDNAEEQVLLKAGSSSRENILKGLIMSSGKMVLLDKLLTRLRKDGHRVLIFSQMVRILDILGDYLSIKGYSFQRLDGTVPSYQRRLSIDHFNSEGSRDFVFLLSTRAGGLGINLMTADTVIIFDSDWNPQADLQAMARAHRIGQKNHVMVYRFVSKDTVEEQVLERARKKMILEYAIISLGVTDTGVGRPKAEPSAGELSEILKFGAGNMFKANENQKKLEDLNLDDVLEHAEDHITTPDLGESHLGGEEFLKQFEVTDYKADVDWDDIIPEEELQKLKEDEKKRKDDEFMKEQLQMYQRREQALKNMKNMYGEDDDAEEDDESRRSSRLKKRKLNDSVITEKEVRMIYKAILRIGDISDSWDMLMEEGSLSNKSKELLQETHHQLVEKSKELIKAEEERRARALKDLEKAALAQKEKENKGVKDENNKDAVALWKLKRKEHKAVLFDFHGAKNLNAEVIVNRPLEMKLIHDLVGDKSVSEFRLPRRPKVVHGWNCEWTSRDDEMLIYGIKKFGYGSWSQIRDDPVLGLGNKMFLNNETFEKEVVTNGQSVIKKYKKVPNSVHLNRRADYLIVLIRGDEEEETTGKKGGSKKVKRSVTPDLKSGDSKNGTKTNFKQMMGTIERKWKPDASVKKMNISKIPAIDDVYSEYESMDDNVCKEQLAPVKGSLKKFKKRQDMERKEWALLLKKELLKIGDHIEKVVKNMPSAEAARTRKHLWLFTSYFWPVKVSSKKIERMYRTKKEQMKNGS